MRLSLTLLLVGVLAVSAFAAGRETPQQRDQRMKWWREARFGMFIHWGLYAIPAGHWKGRKAQGAGEWIMHELKIPPAEYETLLARFNPVKFNARQWVRIAKDAGMKYIVITTKHHDGFCLFDSKFNSYNVMATPFKRDIMKEMADAAHAEGIQICWYHSILDWHHPLAHGKTFPQYFQVLKSQLAELLTHYGHIGVLWFDGEWIPEWNDDYGRELYTYLRSIEPDLIINNRIGKSRKGMTGFSKSDSPGDFGTPEQQIPSTGLPGVDWESCMTMNDTWGYKKDDHNWKSAAQLIRNLVDCASKGGNYLLNVGPTAEGEIPQPSVERLAAIGRWMKINGQSIYATTAGPFSQLDFGRCTRKGDILYLHVFNWPKDKRLSVPLAGKVGRACLLSDPGKPLKTVSSDKGLSIDLPPRAPDSTDTVVELEMRPNWRVVTPGER